MGNRDGAVDGNCVGTPVGNVEGNDDGIIEGIPLGNEVGAVKPHSPIA